MMTEQTEESPLGISTQALHVVAGYATVAGLCPLIPVPFVDDLIVDHIRRRLYQRLSAQHDFYLARDDAKLLSSRQSELLRGALKSLLLWPVKKILRKVVYVLAIKSCADVATEVFHEGWLYARALEQGYVGTESLARGDRDSLERLGDAILVASEEVDPDVTRQVMRSAFGVGREVLQPLLEAIAGVFSREADEERRLDAAQREVAPISARIEEELRAHWALGPELDRALRQALRVSGSSAGNRGEVTLD
jgi:hypothetical protein